jgi:hypothetical protein
VGCRARCTSLPGLRLPPNFRSRPSRALRSQFAEGECRVWSRALGNAAEIDVIWRGARGTARIGGAHGRHPISVRSPRRQDAPRLGRVPGGLGGNRAQPRTSPCRGLPPLPKPASRGSGRGDPSTAAAPRPRHPRVSPPAAHRPAIRARPAGRAPPCHPRVACRPGAAPRTRSAPAPQPARPIERLRASW